MTGQPARKRAAKKTTPARARKETVAEEQPSPAPPVEPEPLESGLVSDVTVEQAQPDTPVIVPDKVCAVCGGKGEVTTDFPWIPPTTFCWRDLPKQYRLYLVPK